MVKAILILTTLAATVAAQEPPKPDPSKEGDENNDNGVRDQAGHSFVKPTINRQDQRNTRGDQRDTNCQPTESDEGFLE